MRWYVIHSKPRQEQRALINLQQQGFECFLPLLAVQKLRNGALQIVQEPLFARYLFIHLSTDQGAQSWAPIRSTQGVSRLLVFGGQPARVDDQLIELLRVQCEQLSTQPDHLFSKGDQVQITKGPFAGLQATFQMDDGERRAMVLIEILGKQSKLELSPGDLQKLY